MTMRRRWLLMAGAFAVAVLALPVEAADAELPVVPQFELTRYVGRWHEIARYPNFFERMCARDVTATYSANPDGTILVANECRKDDGTITRAEGAARVLAPAKLQVRFAPAWLAFLPFVWADYWVIDLAPDYSYAVVGEPARGYLWILARTPNMDEPTYRRIVARIAELGYDPERLLRNSTQAP
jgi:apolipoprotein D and lipocalin family protein